MAISHKVWDFPVVPIRSQLFHVPGIAFDGGWTSGGARIVSPEPGGRAVLEMQCALQVNEWDFPFASWLASKTNGEIFRIQLIRTPQLVSNTALGLTGGDLSRGGVGWEPWGILSSPLWDNGQLWADDGTAVAVASDALEGVGSITVDMGDFGEILKHGHVIGHDDNSYIVDDIEYDGTIATIDIKPPLRVPLDAGDLIYFRPYFLGTISNGDNVKATYDAENVGHIETGTIIFQEVTL